MLINSNKFMTLKTYQRIKLIIVFVLALAISQAIIFKNFLIPLALMVVASLILMFMRRRIKEVVADERDYIIGGKAALLAIQIFSWISAIAMLAFYSFRDLNPSYEAIGMTLALSTCALMLLYSFIFRYYSKAKFSKKKLFLVLGIMAIFVFFVVAARLMSGEDNWVCKDGAWQKHGQPSFPAPNVQCK